MFCFWSSRWQGKCFGDRGGGQRGAGSGDADLDGKAARADEGDQGEGRHSDQRGVHPQSERGGHRGRRDAAETGQSCQVTCGSSPRKTSHCIFLVLQYAICFAVLKTKTPNNNPQNTLIVFIKIVFDQRKLFGWTDPLISCLLTFIGSVLFKLSLPHMHGVILFSTNSAINLTKHYIHIHENNTKYYYRTVQGWTNIVSLFKCVNTAEKCKL